MTDNIVPSTPLAFPRINSPADFRVFLHELRTERLAEHLPRIPARNRDDWVKIAEGLIDHFLKPIPLPDITTWKTLSERVSLLDTVLDCVGQMLRRVDQMLVYSEKFVRTLVVRALDIYNVLEAWVEVAGENDEEEEGYLAPADVRNKALSFLVELLASLDACTLASPGQNTNAREWLKDIIKECIGVCHGSSFFLLCSHFAERNQRCYPGCYVYDSNGYAFVLWDS